MVKYYLTLGLACLLMAPVAMAGNDNKRGQAGATELLINPWARSTGMAGSNAAWVKGVESLNINPAGLVGISNFELNFSNTQYLLGSGVNVNALGFGQRVGDGVLGASVVSYSLGEFFETTYFLPDGTGNTFSPSYINIAASYARTFSEILSAGLTTRIINQAVPNAGATGVSIDAGVQYNGTGVLKGFKIGVALRNIGPKMNYTGDGLNRSGRIDNNPSPSSPYLLSIKNIANEFDMPALYNLGFAYEWGLDGSDSSSSDHYLVPSYTFVSNSFTADQHLMGVEYRWRNVLALRAGYSLSQNVISNLPETDIHWGPTAGLSLDVPYDWFLGANNNVADETDGVKAAKSSRSFGLDFSYRSSRVYGGTYALGLVVKL